jgi:hypothetical protein
LLNRSPITISLSSPAGKADSSPSKTRCGCRPSYRIVVMILGAGSSGPWPSGDHAGLKAADMWPVVARAPNDAVGATARTIHAFKPIPPSLVS